MATEKRKTLAQKKYNPKPFVKRLEQLLEERNETWREASLGAGLDHQTIRRYMIWIKSS